MKILLSSFLLLLLALEAFASDLTLKVGQASPELNFTKFESTDDMRISLSNLEDDVIILDFWASWCEPCIKAIPHLNSLVKTFRGKKVTFISITYEPRKMVHEFLTKHPMESIIGIDNDFAMFRSFKAWGIPMIILINKNRQIAAVTHPDDLTENVINDVLADKFPKVEPHPGWNDPEGAEKYFRSLIADQETSKR